jgi:hypothetical protein
MTRPATRDAMYRGRVFDAEILKLCMHLRNPPQSPDLLVKTRRSPIQKDQKVA